MSYRKGPLGGRGRKPRPGDRIADLACVRDDGTGSRLHAELGGRWTLLLPGDATPESIETARKRLGNYLRVVRDDGKEAMLVRPDSHLAWRSDPGDTAGLDRWLASALSTGRAR